MKVLFAAGDVGGARALLPVIRECERDGFAFAVLRHGHLCKELPSLWEHWVDAKATAMDDVLCNGDIGVLLFASSVHDSEPLAWARRAKELEIPVVHLLDNWTNYGMRLATDGLPCCMPDHYLVMDRLAYAEARAEGIPETILMVSGQPALGSLADEYRSWQHREQGILKEQLGIGAGRQLVVFVSEPVAHDQGESPSCPAFRGYTEKEVLRAFCAMSQDMADAIVVGVLPHPREDSEVLTRQWQECRGKLQGGLIRSGSGREAVFAADAVVGMASLLLYEAWLLGKPVLSLQPALRNRALRMLAHRDGVTFVDDAGQLSAQIGGWLLRLMADKQPPVFRCELEDHHQSSATVCSLLVQWCAERRQAVGVQGEAS